MVFSDPSFDYGISSSSCWIWLKKRGHQASQVLRLSWLRGGADLEGVGLKWFFQAKRVPFSSAQQRGRLQVEIDLRDVLEMAQGGAGVTTEINPLAEGSRKACPRHNANWIVEILWSIVFLSDTFLVQGVLSFTANSRTNQQRPF